MKYLRRTGAQPHEIFLFTEGLFARGDMEEVSEAEALAILTPSATPTPSPVVTPVATAAIILDETPDAEPPALIHTIKSFGFGHWRVMLGDVEVTGNLPKAEAATQAAELNA